MTNTDAKVLGWVNLVLLVLGAVLLSGALGWKLGLGIVALVAFHKVVDRM